MFILTFFMKQIFFFSRKLKLKISLFKYKRIENYFFFFMLSVSVNRLVHVTVFSTHTKLFSKCKNVILIQLFANQDKCSVNWEKCVMHAIKQIRV